MRVVLDTNVLLAAFATRGLCEAIFAVCLQSHEIIASEVIFSEVRRHLSGKFKMPAAQVQSLLEFLREHSQIAEPAHVSSDSCRDPKDLPILGTALADKVDCLVSGDEDLLMLGQFNGIPILSPRTFYEKLL